MRKMVLLFVMANLLMGCDPIHYIEFVNNSNSAAKVKLYLDPKVENYDLKYSSEGDSIVFELKQKDTTRIDFGIGQWSDKEIETISKSIKSIEIETKDMKTFYKTKNAIKNILKENVAGIVVQSKIEIEIH